MSKAQRYKAIKDQLAIIRSYSEPYIEQQNVILKEYYDQGYSLETIAEELEYPVNTVKARLTKMGLNWHNLLPKEIEEDFQVSL